jgi:hypothetical protein
MRAAAKLDRVGHVVCREVLAHGEHADFLAVFLAEQRFRARLNRFVRRHEARGDVGVLAHHRVHFVFDARKLIRRHRLGMTEVETQTIGRDQRTLLRHMGPKHVLERGV